MYDDLKAQLQEWFAGFGRWRSTEDTVRFSQNQEGDGGRALFCTAAHTYALAFSVGYLGCTASARVVRPGEDWTRGSDLPDGPFNKGTFDNIMQAVVAYELVALAPPVEAQPETVPA